MYKFDAKKKQEKEEEEEKYRYHFTTLPYQIDPSSKLNFQSQKYI